MGRDQGAAAYLYLLRSYEPFVALELRVARYACGAWYYVVHVWWMRWARYVGNVAAIASDAIVSVRFFLLRFVRIYVHFRNFGGTQPVKLL